MAHHLKRRLAESVLRSRPDEAARVLQQQSPAVSARALEALRPEQGLGVLRALPRPTAGSVLAVMEEAKARELVQRMPTGAAASLLRRLPVEKGAVLLAALPADRRRGIESLLRQRPRTAGGLANPDVLVLDPGLSAREVLVRFRVELIHATYDIPVVDAEGILVGLLSPRRLTSASKSSPIADLMTQQCDRLPSRLPLSSVATHAAWQIHAALPVVETNGVFIGMLSRAASLSEWTEASSESAERPVSTSQALGDVFGLGVGGIVDALFQPFGREPS